jgi:LmbE family N-acetylglucosaminyl deacetylase
MRLYNRNALFHVPDRKDAGFALGRTTHLGIGAHQDDLEIMAFHGIKECYNNGEKWFGGVTCTISEDFPGSLSKGKDSNDSSPKEARQREQNLAADTGRYSFMLQLNYLSSFIKDPDCTALQEELYRVIKASGPEILYTHNPADKHPTHIAVFFSVIKALRELNPVDRPARVYGCEGWRTLDWLRDEDRIALDVSQHDQLARSLLEVYGSQIQAGKHYDRATMGRRMSNATFQKFLEPDRADQVWYAMDLIPLLEAPTLDVEDFILGHLEKFRENILENLKKYK